MKTTKKEFETFKKEFMRWIKKLELGEYRIDFFLDSLDDCFSEITINHMGRAAQVSLSDNISGRDRKAGHSIKSHAKHEAIHLLIGRLGWLGEDRYITKGDIYEEQEKVVRKLENVLD